MDSNGNPASHFAYSTHENVPDLMLRNESGTWTLYRIVSDEIGTVKAVVRAGDGWVAETYTYADAWGSPYSAFSYQPFGFAGGLYASYEGLYHFGARDYSPLQRQWATKDPSRFAGGLNLYAYCNGDPINCIDPTGNSAIAIGAGAFFDVVVPTVVVAGTAFFVYDVLANDGRYTQRASDAVFGGASCMAEHKKNKRPSTKGKHEKGQTRRGRDRGGEKGDDERGEPRRRPPNWKGPWPPGAAYFFFGDDDEDDDD